MGKEAQSSPSGRRDLSDFGVHPIVLDVFLFLRFSEVFSCDFRFASYTPSFRDFLRGSVSTRRCDSMAQVLFRSAVI